MAGSERERGKRKGGAGKQRGEGRGRKGKGEKEGVCMSVFEMVGRCRGDMGGPVATCK